MLNKFNNKYRTSSIRLPHWDYSSEGYYFVTICAKNKKGYFGEVVNGKMELSEIGKIVKQELLATEKIRDNVKLDTWEIMPNHIHVIFIITYIVETRCIVSLQNKFGPQSNNLASIIRGFKSAVTTYTRKHSLPFSWQPNYYEHVIRSDRELSEIREYIENNPLQWELDEENPDRSINKVKSCFE